MIPHTTLGSGPPLLFLHANGYPPACYEPLLGLLARDHTVICMHQRPLWKNSDPEEIEDWTPLVMDVLQFCEEQGLHNVPAVGHSLGAMMLTRAAIGVPGQFKSIALLDPVLFPPAYIYAFNLARALGIGHKVHPLIPTALKRRRQFDDLEKVFNGYRRRDIFRYFSDANLQILISAITRPATGGGYELIQSPEWEARIYYTGVWRDMDVWRALPKLTTPALIIRGAETDTFLAASARRVEKTAPHIRVETVQETTHLVPLEKPEKVYELIQKHIG